MSGYQGTLEFDWYTNEMKYVRHHAPFSDLTNAAGGLAHFGGDEQLAYNFIDVIQGKAALEDADRDGNSKRLHLPRGQGIGGDGEVCRGAAGGPRLISNFKSQISNLKLNRDAEPRS